MHSSVQSRWNIALWSGTFLCIEFPVLLYLYNSFIIYIYRTGQLFLSLLHSFSCFYIYRLRANSLNEDWAVTNQMKTTKKKTGTYREHKRRNMKNVKWEMNSQMFGCFPWEIWQLLNFWVGFSALTEYMRFFKFAWFSFSAVRFEHTLCYSVIFCDDKMVTELTFKTQ